MTRQQWLWLILGGAGLAYVIYNRQGVATLTESGVDTMTAALSGWQSVQQGPIWIPVINQAESAYGIPTNLLARMAYQESSFRPNVIDGTYPNPKSGALGILQMLPKYFQSVNRPIPFSTTDTQDQITEAAQLLSSLYNTFQDWGLAIAAYNDGATNIKNYLAGNHPLPTETSDYVSAVLADVPVASAWASA